ncbi:MULTISPECIES: hypothetical protein [Streptomyces]|uniref:hypothetical protein n=1 Tax=Streptomyces TaxID=1883 RepID=UPI00131E8BCF|nr:MULTISPECIES: hypothetical protein [Streptomyces]
MKSNHLWGVARGLLALSTVLIALGLLLIPDLFGTSAFSEGSGSDSQPVAVSAIIGIISAITGLVTAVASLITALMALHTIRTNARGDSPSNAEGASRSVNSDEAE